MPKKQKRRVSAPAEPSAFAPSATGTTRAAYTQEFNPDYSHVKRDLKQIGFMAGSFFA